MRKASPKVTIIIPVYNGSNFLAEAIDSALAQTYSNKEILVINDGSTDDGATEAVAKSYGSQIDYYYKENGGVASALNFGIKKMAGDYFSWLSHDDMYEPTKIQKQIEYLRSQATNKGKTIIASNTKTLFENGLVKYSYIHKATFKYIDIFLATSAKVGVNGCALLIPKAALIKSGGFNENLLYTQDYDLWFRLKDICEFVVLDEPLVISRRHRGQDSVQKTGLCNRAADSLHQSFLREITKERFEEYFLSDRANFTYSRKNYYTYKDKGMVKTASALLGFLLLHAYTMNRPRFRQMVNKEVNLEGMSNKLIKHGIITGNQSKINTNTFEELFNDIVDSGIIYQLPLKRKVARMDRGPLSKAVYGLINGIQDDGILFTLRRGARKLRLRIWSQAKK